MTTAERAAMSSLECAVWGAAYVALLSNDHSASADFTDHAEMLASPEHLRQGKAIGGADEAVFALRRRIG